MLRISEAPSNKQTITLRLEGQVVGEWVGELRQVCETLLTKGRAVKLDLADVAFADAAAVAMLSNFNSRGVTFANCSPFLEKQLKSPVTD